MAEKPPEVLDVPCTKIAEWAQGRRKLPKNWASLLKNANALKNKAMSASAQQVEVAQMLADLEKDKLPVTFVFVDEAMEILVKCAGQKNIIGQYSSVVTQAWYNLQNSYKKQNVFLGEASRIIAQNLNYEIPGLRKSIEAGNKFGIDFYMYIHIQM
eukprot:Platyproteum_vivax@DN16695_c0_g1_i1.p1